MRVATRQTIVSPARGGTESKWLLLLTILILTICFTIVSARTHGNTESKTESWQLSAFSDLNSFEIGVFNSLQIAAIEIGQVHDIENGRWMGAKELKANYIPPFVKDAAWHKQGEIQWKQKLIDAQNRHIALYKGKPSTGNAVGGTFLLLMLHDHQKKQGNAAIRLAHKPFEIWFHKTVDQKFPTVITDQALINSGWLEIIALTGEDEITRIKGKTIQ